MPLCRAEFIFSLFAFLLRIPPRFGKGKTVGPAARFAHAGFDFVAGNRALNATGPARMVGGLVKRSGCGIRPKNPPRRIADSRDIRDRAVRVDRERKLFVYRPFGFERVAIRSAIWPLDVSSSRVASLSGMNLPLACAMGSSITAGRPRVQMHRDFGSTLKVSHRS